MELTTLVRIRRVLHGSLVSHYSCAVVRIANAGSGINRYLYVSDMRWHIRIIYIGRCDFINYE